MNGIINYIEIQKKTIKEVVDIIEKSEKINLKDLKFLDILPVPKTIIFYTGIYIFYRDNECISVNRPYNVSAKQSYLEFDSRFFTWLNILIKKINKDSKLTLFESYDIVIPELSILLINFTKEYFTGELYDKVSFLEQALRQHLRPKYNYTKPPYFSELLSI